MSSRAHLVTLASLLAFAGMLALIGGGAAQAGPSFAEVRNGPAVDAALMAQLSRDGVDSADAVITTRSRADLAAVRRAGVNGTTLRFLPMILVRDLTDDQLARVRRLPGVRSVWANTRHRILMEDTTWITRARYAWEKSNSNGGLPGLDTTGRGIHIAVIDTGADVNHDDMENVVEFCETIQAVNASHTEVACTPDNPLVVQPNYGSGTNVRTDCAVTPPTTCDDQGHGTHVSGTIAGTGSASGGRAHPHSTIGVAPDAKLHVYSANVGLNLLNHQILAAYDDLIYKKVRGVYPTVAVSNSWGGGGGYDPNSPQSIAFKEAYFVGILSVFAAGNTGPEHNTTSAQCNNPFVVCVAATTKPDHIAMFSSRGRPSEPQDVNRDGTIGANEGPPDNHDIKLGRAFDVGVYRPRVAAPGVNVNSANANAAQCRESNAVGTPESALSRGCYTQLQGTSMATPHVSGVVALIAEAYHKGHDNKLPTPQIITEILERSSNEMHKLPGWESEEQGTGRIDAYRAVELAKNYPFGMKEPILGHPVPNYQGPHPGADQVFEFKGCTGHASWIVPEIPFPSGTEPSPIATERFGQHFIKVDPKAERLRVTVDWGSDPARPQQKGANIYLRLWRPGVNPDTAESRVLTPQAHQVRAMADNEATGATFVGDRRFVEVRAPEETTGVAPPKTEENPEIPSGLWILRVYHRGTTGAPGGCGDTQETPQIVERASYEYKVNAEVTYSQTAPTARITEPRDGAVIEDRWTKIGANSSMPPQWDGITNFEVPGTENPAAIPEPDNRKVLWFHGNKHATTDDPGEINCTGVGNADTASPTCRGPLLLATSQLSPHPAAVFSVPNTLLNLPSDRNNPNDPNWTWYLTQPTSLYGPMTVEFWASCGACDYELGLTAAWNIRLWADGELVFQRRVTATPHTPEVPDRLEATVFVPTIVTANNRFTLHVDPVFIDSQNDTRIYYDSTQACLPAANPAAPCDSLVRMPVVTSGQPGAGPPPQRVRVTDVHQALRVAWTHDPTAQRYEIHRSADPAFIPNPRTRIAVTEGYDCVSPRNATWQSYDRPGRCYDDTGGFIERTYYYRVIAIRNGVRSLASLLAYGMRTPNDRLTLMKVDRLYGPQYWEHATLDATSESSWHYWWDTLQLVVGPHKVSTRATSQGIPSTRDSRTYNDAGTDK